ncbi:LmbU family transcriptional regulator [Nocardiopsis deserti]|uniref:LmbU family transcriptional regulator n=1 Tax=Nocardiopsis deserti TaxID=2605988 RepID=UPI001CC23744|nr:LmbU family transcriptional regulator [Nocardiopsis deserti]
MPVEKSSTKRTSLQLPEGLIIAEWEKWGNHIFVISDASGWWLGDWLIYGQRNYPNRYKSAIEKTSLDYQTLRNYAWVARKFVPGRRREKLSFQHHAEVCSLPESEQEQWLARAEAGRWSRNELRRRIKMRIKEESTIPETTYVQVAINPERKKQWQEAAENSGMSLPQWASEALDRAAQKTVELA